MTSATNLKDLEDSLKELPNELNQNLTMMLDLGSKSKELMTGIDKMADNYMLNFKKNSAEENKKNMENIQQKFDAAKELSDDKVQLSIQTYELVDKHIRILDSEIAKFEAQMKLNAEIRDTVINATRNLQQQRGIKSRSAPFSVSTVADRPKPINSVANVVNRSSHTDTGVVNLADADMPIDPNEPKFCLCNQVSFGEMIGCDDPDCVIEWFHFACVNLTTKPKGKWICPKCTKDKKKK
ncbi:PREDICTED: inhibitor of growth protein 4-like [Diuraphis noxia]|uniref:inhibitor of growth protein 4-like n=1 Tax=Diuraphis noxia TaxID=143948 RepID=UPI0007636836|nr:PREDICTED: inhibitor of growth protein 4-like [Diuraphis noxia]